MKTISYCFIIILTIATLANTLYAKNLELSIYGNGERDQSDPKSRDDASEYRASLYYSACKIKKGWDVQAITSNSKDKTNLFNNALARTLYERKKRNVHQVNMTSITLDDEKTDNSKVTKEYIKKLKQITSSLKSGDQFLLKVKAHGSSTCQANKNINKALRFIKDFKKCEYSFSVWPKGIKRSIKIKAHDFIPLLQSIKKRGVKVGVSIYSCYSGAAINSFAQAGLCAQAFSTPDTQLHTCGTPYKSLDAANTADMSDAYFCKGLKKGDIRPFYPLIRKGNVNVTVDKADANLRKCAEQSHDNVNKTSFQKNPTLSSVYDRLRHKDKTTNLPISSNGPYWITGSMSFMGSIIQEMSAQYSSCKRCRKLPAFQVFNNKLTSHINKLTKQLKPKCNINTPLSAFLKNRTNKRVLKSYYKKYKSLSDFINGKFDYLGTRYRGLKRRAGQYVSTMCRTAHYYTPQEKKISCPIWKKNPINHLLTALAIYSPPFGENKGDPRFEAIYKIFGRKASHTKIKKIRSLLKSFASVVKRKRKKLEKYQRQQIIPLERKLYSKLKQSNEFKSCLRLSPGLQKAKKDCDSFKI